MIANVFAFLKRGKRYTLLITQTGLSDLFKTKSHPVSHIEQVTEEKRSIKGTLHPPSYSVFVLSIIFYHRLMKEIMQ